MAGVLLDSEVIEGEKVREIIDNFEKRHSMKSRLAHTERIEREKSDKERRAAESGRSDGEEDSSAGDEPSA
jgi:cell division protease FtsH